MGHAIRTRHEVIFTQWDESAGDWWVKVRNSDGEFEDRAHYLIDARGILK